MWNKRVRNKGIRKVKSKLAKNTLFKAVFLSSIFTIFLSSQFAQAYIPPTPYLLNRFQTFRSAAKKFEWTGKIQRVGATDIAYELVQVDFISGKVRLYYGMDPTFKLKKSKPISEMSEMGRAWLGAQFAIPGSAVPGLTRVQGRPVWNLKVEAEKGESPFELLIEKDRFLFSGIRLGSDSVEVVEPASAETAIKFPKKVSILQSNQPKFFYELIRFKIGTFTNVSNQNSDSNLDLSSPAMIEEWISLVR